MLFSSPVVGGTLLRRYKRFLADVRLEDGRVVTAHCANPGAMTGLAEEGLRVWLLHRPHPRRKLDYSWEVVEAADGALVGVNTHTPNRLVAEALEGRELREYEAYSAARAEAGYGEGSRVDFLLGEPGLPDLYLEVKSVTLSRTLGVAEFPDAVTTRGARHLRDLARVRQGGCRAAVLYVVQRSDCGFLRLAADIDPAFAAAAAEARSAGVEMHCQACRVSGREIALERTLPIEFEC